MKRILTILALAVCVSAAAKEPVRHTLRHAGTEREYYVYMPENLRAEKPLVIMLHGYGGKAKGYFPELWQAAEEHGFALCFPQGLKDPGKGRTGWNVGYPFQEGWKQDDISFVLALKRRVCREFGLDPMNVFFSGMSNGGEMCYYLARRAPKEFGAIASLAGLQMAWIYERWPLGAKVPFIEVHGTDDTTSRWNGDPENKDGWGRYIAVPLAVYAVAVNNGATFEKTDTLALYRPDSHVVVEHRYCGGVDTRLYEVIGGKHSRATGDIPTAELMLEFFEEHFRQ